MAFDFGQTSLACILAGIATSSLAKDSKDALAMGSGICAAFIGYEALDHNPNEDLVKRVDKLDSDVTAFMDDAMKRIQRNHKKAAKAYKLYRKVIRKSVVKKINDVKEQILKEVDTKKLERKIERRITKKLEDKVIRSVEKKIDEAMAKGGDKLTKEDVEKIIEDMTPLIVKEFQIKAQEQEIKRLKEFNSYTMPQ